MNDTNENMDQLSKKLLSYLKEELMDSSIGYSSGLEKLKGGYETAMYRFTLSGAQEEISKPLVLRLYPEFASLDKVVWESTIQNILASEGLPAAKVFFVNKDKSILGGAFFIMEYLPGSQLETIPDEDIPEIFGNSHALLHKIAPAPIIDRIQKRGTEEYKIRYSREIYHLKNRAEKLPWIRDGRDWLIENRPQEPKHLAICHLDFHTRNILVENGKVTGILDWGNFKVADPALDVASTLMLITITGRLLLGENVDMDPDILAERYLKAYRAHKDLDSKHIEFYQASRCIWALTIAFKGKAHVWARPTIVRDLVAYIKEITGIRIAVPAMA